MLNQGQEYLTERRDKLGPLQVWLFPRCSGRRKVLREREEQEERPGDREAQGMLSEGPKGTEVQSKRLKAER